MIQGEGGGGVDSPPTFKHPILPLLTAFTRFLVEDVIRFTDLLNTF